MYKQQTDSYSYFSTGFMIHRCVKVCGHLLMINGFAIPVKANLDVMSCSHFLQTFCNHSQYYYSQYWELLKVEEGILKSLMYLNQTQTWTSDCVTYVAKQNEAVIPAKGGSAPYKRVWLWINLNIKYSEGTYECDVQVFINFCPYSASLLWCPCEVMHMNVLV